MFNTKNIFNLLDIIKFIMAKEDNYSELKKELKELKKKVSNYEKQVEQKVQEHPIASLGIAFGAGMLIGSLIKSLISRKN